MSEGPSPVPSAADFIADVERLLAPGYAEPFTDGTKKMRNLLLLTSLVLFLVALGAAEVGQEAVKLPLLPLSITVKWGMRWVLVLLCAYFLIMFVMQSYIEWKSWRLRHQSPVTRILNITAGIESSLNAYYKRINETLAQRVDALNELDKLYSDSSAASPLRQKIDVLHERFHALVDEIIKKRGSVGDEEISKLYEKKSAVYEELTPLEDQMRNERMERRKQIEALSAPLVQRLADLDALSRSQAAAPELRDLEEKRQSVYSAMRPVGNILRCRRWIEFIFPIVFGASAIAIGLFGK